MAEAIHVISLGAGVQSSTMALMAAHGEIAVYDWLKLLIGKLPFPVYVVSHAKGKLSKPGNLFRGDHSQIPAFMPGKIGKRQCTNDWKLRPIRRKMRQLSEGKSVVQWIGISIDEVSRAKDSDVQWITNLFPLLDKRMSRRDCVTWLKKHGLEEVPKSACVYCPYHSDRQWREFKDANGSEWRQIVWVDRLLNARGEFLHRSCQPIAEVDFSTEEERGQLNMFNNECTGLCGV